MQTTITPSPATGTQLSPRRASARTGWLWTLLLLLPLALDSASAAPRSYFVHFRPTPDARVIAYHVYVASDPQQLGVVVPHRFDAPPVGVAEASVEIPGLDDERGWYFEMTALTATRESARSPRYGKAPLGESEPDRLFPRPEEVQPLPWFEDFEGEPRGVQPESLVEVDARGEPLWEERGYVIGHDESNAVMSTEEPRLSRAVAPAGLGAGWTNYDFTARVSADVAEGEPAIAMLKAGVADDATGGYRLVLLFGQGRAVIGLPGSACGGSNEASYPLLTGLWYRTRLRMTVEPIGTRIQGRVWYEGVAEPNHWQIECLDQTTAAVRAGTVGVESLIQRDGLSRVFFDQLVAAPISAAEDPGGEGDPSEETEPGCENDLACSDGNLCNGVETCVAGTCQTGRPVQCTSAGACLNAFCSPTAGCLQSARADGTVCDDGDSETLGDVCVAGSCAGSSCLADVHCADGDVCNGAEICSGGICYEGDRLSCPNPGPCEIGYCSILSGCRSVTLTDGSSCDDGDPRTPVDTCFAGVCEGAGCREDAHCDDGNPCNGVERCSSGQCQAGVPGLCTSVSVDLDGSSEHLSSVTPALLDFGPFWSVSLWIKPTRLAGDRVIFRAGPVPSEQNSITVASTGSSGTFLVLVAGDESVWLEYKGTLEERTWHHLLITGAAGRIETFADGQLLAPIFSSGEGPGLMLDAPRVVSLGTHPRIPNLNSEMRLGHTAIWSRALTGAEVSALYWNGHTLDLRAPTEPLATGLVHYWRPGDDATAIGRDFAGDVPLDAAAGNLTYESDVVIDAP